MPDDSGVGAEYRWPGPDPCRHRGPHTNLQVQSARHYGLDHRLSPSLLSHAIYFQNFNKACPIFLSRSAVLIEPNLGKETGTLSVCNKKKEFF